MQTMQCIVALSGKAKIARTIDIYIVSKVHTFYCSSKVNTMYSNLSHARHSEPFNNGNATISTDSTHSHNAVFVQCLQLHTVSMTPSSRLSHATLRSLLAYKAVQCFHNALTSPISSPSG